MLSTDFTSSSFYSISRDELQSVKLLLNK